MNYIEELKKDIHYGLTSEEKIKIELEDYFHHKLFKLSKYNKFDFISEDKKLLIELKTRRCTLNTYPTTMIPHQKIEYGLKLLKEKEIYLFFKFEDGLFYYQLNENIYDEVVITKGGRKDRGRYEYNQYVFIPVNLLKKI